MRIIKVAITAISIGALLGCAKQAETTTSRGDFVVDTLFTVDGCTVYRFRDLGSARYFTNCSGSTEWRESCGKNCVREVSISGGGRQ